jgi:MFS family permease
MVVAGSAICVISLIWASFANSIAELIASQGALYGTGVLIVYAPLVSMLNEWFVERRGLAYGVMFAGGGVSGVGLPFLMEWLLATYGYRTAFRVIAIAQAILLAPVLPLIKGRLPPNRHERAIVDFDFLRNPQFWVLTLSNFLQGFAIYIPSIYLPTFATHMGLSSRTGALLLAALNIASTLGQVGFGHLSDRFSNIFILVFITTFVSAIASFCIWGFAQSLAPLLIYTIIFGLFGGAYVVFWPKFALLSKDPLLLYGLMAFGKGVGNVVTGPITARLLAPPASSGYGLGTYKNVILYAGTLLLASSIGIIGWPMRSMAIRRESRNEN